MARSDKVATVFGGTGFLGRQVVRELAKRGITVKVATRVPECAYFLRPCGTVGQIVPLACDYKDENSIIAAVAGSDYVVNCIGILFEKRKGQFCKVHTELAGKIADACARADVKRFVHISALGCDKGTSNYAKTKLAGEAEVRKNFPKATILRPSVLFGEDDNFFNMFARLAQVFPALPLIGGGKTKFQPVFAGDVADAVMAALEIPAALPNNPQGKIYELGGPEIVTFRQIYEILFDQIGKKRALIPLPWWLAKIDAFFLSFLPRPPLTPDQVESLRTDNIVTPGTMGLSDLGVRATAMELVLPHYLGRFRNGRRYNQPRKAA